MEARALVDRTRTSSIQDVLRIRKDTSMEAHFLKIVLLQHTAIITNAYNNSKLKIAVGQSTASSIFGQRTYFIVTLYAILTLSLGVTVNSLTPRVKFWVIQGFLWTEPRSVTIHSKAVEKYSDVVVCFSVLPSLTFSTSYTLASSQGS